VPEPDLAKLASNLVAGAPDGSRYTTDSFPLGVWGQPKALSAPTKPVPSSDVVVTGNRVILVAGIETATTGPQIDYYQVTSGTRPLPLRATGNDRTALLQQAATLGTLTASGVDESLQVAAATLFGPAATTASPLGRAAYRNTRVSPPRFGNLADGLALIIGADGAREAAPAKPAAVAPVARAPFVAGYFSSGPGAAARAARTTVGDGRIKRRPAPTTASVRGRLGVHIPAVLERVSPPTIAQSGTMLAGLAVPRSDIVGAVRSTSFGSVGGPSLDGIVGGIGAAGRAPQGRRRPRADAEPSTIPTGDVVMLQLPDARIDTGDDRPEVRVGGRARVVMVAAHGVLHDDDAIDTSVVVPPGTMFVGVQADGDADATDGWSGWHERSRVGLLATRAAVGAGCTIVTEGGPEPTSNGWTTAGAMTLGAVSIQTRFTRTVRTLAVALTGASTATLDQTELHIVGARIATDRDGVQRKPVMVTLGHTAVLVYDLVPERDADHVNVVVNPGADWAVSGVIAAGLPSEPRIDADDLAAQIARRGLGPVTAQLTVMHGPGCTIEWVAPPTPDPPQTERPPRRAATKKTAAKKTAAKKPTAKKTAAKKSAAKKPTAKKTAAKKAPAKRQAERTAGGRTRRTR
jgi:hypothetical protein